MRASESPFGLAVGKDKLPEEQTVGRCKLSVASGYDPLVASGQLHTGRTEFRSFRENSQRQGEPVATEVQPSY